MPSHARPERLVECLRALALQDHGPYRTVVVDDGSPESVAGVCAAYPWVVYHRQENAGPAAARNAGARLARDAGASFLCFTDDDCRPHPGWARALRDANGGDPSRLVGGRVQNALPGNIYATTSQSLCDFLYEYHGADRGTAPFFTSNNIGCSTDAFFALGGFDVNFPLAAAEDRDFGLRWQDRLGPLHYAPDAVVDHAHALTLRRFWAQHSNYGRGAHHLHRVMDARGDGRPRREKLGFYAGLMAYPLRRRGARFLAQSALMGLSQVAMVSGYLRQSLATRTDRRGG